MKNIKKAYESLVNEYLTQFIKKHDLPELEFWVSDEVGGIAMIGDYYFNFQDIKLDIDDNVPEPTILEWYDFSVENESKVNYKSWVNGHRPIKCWISMYYFFIDNVGQDPYKYARENNFEVKCVEEFEFSLGVDHQYEVIQYLDALSKCQKLILPEGWKLSEYSVLEHEFFLLNQKRTEDDIIYV